MSYNDYNTDPCKTCKNGPEPSNLCLNCSNFSYGCKVHDIDPTTFNPLKINTTETTHVANIGSKTGLYTEEQKRAVNEQLEFLNKVIKSMMKNNIPFNSGEEAFFKCIFEDVLKCIRYKSHADSCTEYLGLK